MRSLDEILYESSIRHKHLCPRQVLGARMGLAGAEILGIDLPRNDKQLLVISETDGCTVDGLIAATGCRVGSRTLRIHDYGKVAATFVDTCTEEAIRVGTIFCSARTVEYAIGANHEPSWQKNHL
jgi:formylmethanofuran dehydrogenase subunit E